jgi:hypothetical protein
VGRAGLGQPGRNLKLYKDTICGSFPSSCLAGLRLSMWYSSSRNTRGANEAFAGRPFAGPRGRPAPRASLRHIGVEGAKRVVQVARENDMVERFMLPLLFLGSYSFRLTRPCAPMLRGAVSCAAGNWEYRFNVIEVDGAYIWWGTLHGRHGLQYEERRNEETREEQAGANIPSSSHP